MDNGYEPVTALLNDLIVENVFENLSLSDIGVCRQVCTKWKAIGNLFLKKRRVFPFRFKTAPLRDASQCVEDVDKVINSNYPSFQDINFNKFRFSWSIKSHRMEFITEVVKKYCENCTQAYLFQCDEFNYLIRERLERLPKFDITPSIGHYLTLLSVISTSSFMSISLKCLTNIQYLYLCNCTVLLTDDMIKPRTLFLCNVSFMKDGQIQKTVTLKTFADFSILKELYLVTEAGTLGSPFPYIIDEKDKSISLDTFQIISHCGHFINAGNINLDNLQWSVKNLSVDGYLNGDDEVLLNCQPKLKNVEVLDLRNVYIWEDCTWIPNNIKKLSLTDGVVLPDSGKFSNVKYLSLSKTKAFHDMSDSISLLLHCKDSLQNVEYLEIGCESETEARSIESSMIPKNVKRLTLKGKIYLICDDERHINLERLILCNYPWQEIEVLQYKFSAELLVISNSNINNGDEGCEKLIELILHHSCAFKNIAVGEFQWEAHFSTKCFSMKQYIRDKANYYLFKKREGTLLEKTVFNDLCNQETETDYPQIILNWVFYDT